MLSLKNVPLLQTQKNKPKQHDPLSHGRHNHWVVVTITQPAIFTGDK